MTDQQLEQRLRAWYRDEIGHTESAPLSLRDALAEIPAVHAPATPGSRRGLVVLAVAAMLAVAGTGAILVLSGVLPPPRPGPIQVMNGVIGFGQAGEDGTSHLYVMESDGTDVRQVPGIVNPDGVSWSPDGTRAAYAATDALGGGGVYVINADGSGLESILPYPGSYSSPAWSPLGHEIAFSQADGSGAWDVYVVNVDGSDLRQLTEGPESDLYPAWSPDASQLTFARASPVGDGFEDAIMVMNADGSALRALTRMASIVSHPAWAPDGRQIAFSYREFPATGLPTSYDPPWDIWIMGAEGAEPHPLVADAEWSELRPSWAPDGTQITFSGDSADGFGIYVMNADGTNVHLIQGPGPLYQPAWAAALLDP